MASVKKSKRISKIEKKNEPLIEPKPRTTRLQSGTGGSKNARGGRNRQSSAVPLLDMLAEVASATLQNEEEGALAAKTRERKSRRAAALAAKLDVVDKTDPAYLAELLNLDQIRVLSDRMLLEMFAEMTSDEIKRHYAYKCYLVPEKCSETFKSFGSETRARLQMKSHLLTHIAELLAEANGKQAQAATKANPKTKFMAEPLHARTRRIQENLLKRTRSKSNPSPATSPTKKPPIATTTTSSTTSSTPVPKIKKEFQTAAKPKAEVKRKAAVKKKQPPVGMKATFSHIMAHRNAPGKIKDWPVAPAKSNEDEESDETESETESDTDTDLEDICSPEKRRISEDECPLPATIVISAPSTSFHNILYNRDSSPEPPTIDPTIPKPIVAAESTIMKFVIDTIKQPGHDHNYTSVMGKKRGIQALHYEFEISSGEDDVDENREKSEMEQGKRGYMYENPQLIVATPSFPFVYVPLLPNIAQILEIVEQSKKQHYNRPNRSQISPIPMMIESPPLSAIEIQRQRELSSAINSLTNESFESSPAPLMTSSPPRPKQTRVRKTNKVIVPEEHEPMSSSGDEISQQIPLDELEAEEQLSLAAASIVKNEFGDEGAMVEGEEPIGGEEVVEMEYNDDNQPIPGSKFTKLLVGQQGVPEWERKLALKCIRNLRTRRKEDRGPLVCKICKNRTFTAQATLMYHYRSHAGIKPFICNLCGATFTRQHSLNYHMLIHNNKSRFVCEDCGRNFRHPSHYKEHLRRHTGETPYECSDCTLRFKTRNTYKRHLKTRHGKILTAQGIITLSLEEFYKVRTNPRRKAYKDQSEMMLATPEQLLVNHSNLVVVGEKRDQETQWPEALGTIQEICVTDGTTIIEGTYYACPPEAVAFQVVNGTSDYAIYS